MDEEVPGPVSLQCQRDRGLDLISGNSGTAPSVT